MLEIDNKKLKKIYLLEKFILFFIFTVFFCVSMKYPCLSNDDILDVLCLPFFMDHGRFFTSIFKIFLLRELPEFLNIHYQDFAFFSQTIFKAVFLTLIIFSTVELSVFFQ